jgi:hypothetical protein
MKILKSINLLYTIEMSNIHSFDIIHEGSLAKLWNLISFPVGILQINIIEQIIIYPH